MITLPDRRRFLTAAGGLLGGACLGGPLTGRDRAGGALAGGTFAGRIRIAVKYQMIKEPELGVREKFELLRGIGFDGVELTMNDPVDRDEIEKAIETTGLPVHGIVNAADPDIEPAVVLARRLGADSVLVLAKEDPAESYEENFAHWQENVRRALPLAEKHGVRLCIENVRATFLKTAEGMARFIDSFDSEAVRSYFDLGNTITWTEQSAQHWADVLGERIYKLDIKDRGHPEFGDPKLAREGAVGTNGGEVHWEKVRAELDEVGFRGWATAEVAGGDRKRLAGIAGWMRDVMDVGG
ncbi:MAG: sugar phosphate isomerase/epimerase family protein [Verrucomicrobiales bacterium]